MPSFTSIDEITEYLFDGSLQDDEGELHIALVLLSHMTGYIKKGRKNKRLGILLEKNNLIIFNKICPKGWGIQKTYIYLFLLFLKLGIKPEAVFHKDIFLQYNKLAPEYDLQNEDFDKFYNKGEVDQIFQNPYFFQLGPEILEFIEIKNTFDTDENIKKIEDIINAHIDDFVSGKISEKHKLLPYEQQRNKLFSKLSDFYSLNGNNLHINESRLVQYKGISIIYMMVLLWKLDYIYIFNFNALSDTPEFDENGRYKCEKEELDFHILVTHKAQTLFDGLFKMKNLLLDKIFDEEYKKISITKKGGELHILEGEKEIDATTTHFVDLQKKFPHSEIKAKNYNGKATKYEVKEKIRLG